MKTQPATGETYPKSDLFNKAHLNYTLSDNQDIINMYRAADHRRAELVSGGRLFNVGEVPKSVWRYVL
ncbi:transcription modulator YdgT [Enterobacter cloacae]|uniref:transcription modulator YdgT n=2 Tax=Enterobacter TaxID=547 RepID=UPI0039C1B568